ncbi:hypothetical protein D5S18_22070 [Nocardia panacis]|uniref:DUF7172 domain-containing protein n=1 Tax=Nocardia panacis TaxID=2340916 RepID=A0A3A4KJ59_9NOCA|nr:hypothetical protein [Nocardia panacis]RJO72966.1 hypothetical protein D5S18_22070 [Nocardia panacis]
MSITICTASWMQSSPTGTGFADAWRPRVVAERFVTSTKDGDVQQAPDPVPFIDAELTWTNTGKTRQRARLGTQRAPRQIVAANPNMYVLNDGISWDVGLSPNAPAPYAGDDGIACRLQITPFAVNQIYYGRLFRGWPDSLRYDEIGTVLPGQSVHIRYRALYSTPGQWRAPNQALQTVRAYWVRLRLWAEPEATP